MDKPNTGPCPNSSWATRYFRRVSTFVIVYSVQRHEQGNFIQIPRPQLGSYSGNLTVTQSFDGALAEVDNEPTVILVGTNGIALQWLDPDPGEEVRSGGVEYVREVSRNCGRTLLNTPPFLSLRRLQDDACRALPDGRLAEDRGGHRLCGDEGGHDDGVGQPRGRPREGDRLWSGQDELDQVTGSDNRF